MTNLEDITPAEAGDILDLLGSANLHMFREDIEKMVESKYTPEGLAKLFYKFVALAKSVDANLHERAKTYVLEAYKEAGVTVLEGQVPNLPSLMGALDGIVMAAGVTTKARCKTCAFRPGTPANPSLITVHAASECVRAG